MVNRFYFLIYFLITHLFSCQVYNSATNDSYQFASDGTAFGDAKVVFSMKCTPCHNYYLRTEQDFKTSGYLSGGDLYSSSIYYRIKGVNLGVGNEDMPPNGQLTDDEITIIKNWVESVAP